MMLEEVLRYLRNWFVLPSGVHAGRFVVERGGLTLPFLQDGQYFRVAGSVLNDGVYQYPAEDMADEAFDGTVWALAVPKAVLELAEEIAAWQEQNGGAAASPYQSESFGGYTYTKAAGPVTGEAATWQNAFAGRLSQWRKL